MDFSKESGGMIVSIKIKMKMVDNDDNDDENGFAANRDDDDDVTRWRGRERGQIVFYYPSFRVCIISRCICVINHCV